MSKLQWTIAEAATLNTKLSTVHVLLILVFPHSSMDLSGWKSRSQFNFSKCSAAYSMASLRVAGQILR